MHLFVISEFPSSALKTQRIGAFVPSDFQTRDPGGPISHLLPFVSSFICARPFESIHGTINMALFLEVGSSVDVLGTVAEPRSKLRRDEEKSNRNNPIFESRRNSL